MNDDDGDDVSGGETAGEARPYYFANKDGKHKYLAVAILDNPARICHLIDQGCELCNSEGIICVQGPRGKCARYDNLFSSLLIFFDSGGAATIFWYVTMVDRRHVVLANHLERK
ncbi:hypothetical protein K3495_g3353 [Podosphaera aphanis]|nr:hypothetical protein K3495_g3353 [Podosphaera aphanis]